MTHDEIQKRLDELAVAMTEAAIPTPEATLMVKSGGRHSIHLDCRYDANSFDGKNYKIFTGHDIDALLSRAFEYITAMPDPDTAAKHAWQRKLGTVIDEGHALNLPDEVMVPLRTGSQAMAENLLAAPGVDA